MMANMSEYELRDSTPETTTYFVKWKHHDISFKVSKEVKSRSQADIEVNCSSVLLVIP